MNGSVAVSTLTFRPIPDDDGTILKCEGSNPRLPNSALEDSIVLVVMCKWKKIHRNLLLFKEKKNQFLTRKSLSFIVFGHSNHLLIFLVFSNYKTPSQPKIINVFVKLLSKASLLIILINTNLFLFSMLFFASPSPKGFFFLLCYNKISCRLF